MIVYQETGLQVDARWQDSTRTFLVEANWHSAPFGRHEFEQAQEALEYAAHLAGVPRLSSMWLWRLCEQQIRPHLADGLPDLVDVTNKPWETRP